MLALSWSGGKDSVLALEALTLSGRRPDLLFSTVDGEREVMPHHETPVGLLRCQAEAIGLPLILVEIPAAAADVDYESRMREAFAGPLSEVGEVAFGDLFLEDLKAYRESRMAEAGRAASFPLWRRDTKELAFDFAERFEATVCSVDLDRLPGFRPGIAYDREFLDSLPHRTDPCGERGEFHTFVHGGPVFSAPLEVKAGEAVASADGRFLYAAMAW